MKNSKIIASGLIVLFGTSTFAAGVNVFAADANSKGPVEFVTDSNTNPKPFDPTDPTVPPKEVNPTDPTKPDGPGNGTNGLLRFDRVPNFKFEKITIGSAKQTGNVLQEEYTDTTTGTKFYAAPTVEITDVTASTDGWVASVSVDGELKGSTNTINGYELKLNKGVISSYSGVTTTPTLHTGLTLNTAPSVLAEAKEDDGRASWGISFYDSADATASKDGKPAQNTTGTPTASDAVTLTIPHGSVMKTNDVYTTDLTWTLVSA